LNSHGTLLRINTRYPTQVRGSAIFS
jgi:hypothetical protein